LEHLLSKRKAPGASARDFGGQRVEDDGIGVMLRLAWEVEGVGGRFLARI
jgi:hypothetical protein